MIANFRFSDYDGDAVRTETPEDGKPESAAFIVTDRDGVYLTREGTVGLIAALTDLIEAHDAEEARKTEAAAKEARKLKRGDRVRGRYTGKVYTVVSDETDDGRVDVVPHEVSGLWPDEPANSFVK